MTNEQTTLLLLAIKTRLENAVAEVRSQLPTDFFTVEKDVLLNDVEFCSILDPLYQVNSELEDMLDALKPVST